MPIGLALNAAVTYCQNPGRTTISYSTYLSVCGAPGEWRVRPAVWRSATMAAVPVSPLLPMSLPTPLQESPPSPAPAAAGSRARAPLVRLALGLTLSLLTIIGFCLYAAHEIGRLRDEQMALSERNRRDSLQLIRIQNNLSTLAITLRDMTDETEPYPMAAWASTFDRLELDLQQALRTGTLARARAAGRSSSNRSPIPPDASGRPSIARWRSPDAATRRRPSKRSAPTRCRATPSS